MMKNKQTKEKKEKKYTCDKCGKKTHQVYCYPVHGSVCVKCRDEIEKEYE